MVGRDGAGRPPDKRLGRGLSEVSHLFLSSAEKRREAEDGPHDRMADSAFWLPRAVFLSVTSGEGVRGKTFLTANFAYGLASGGRRVAVVNADPDRPDLADMIAGASNAYPANSLYPAGSCEASDLWNRLPIWDAIKRSPLVEPPTDVPPEAGGEMGDGPASSSEGRAQPAEPAGPAEPARIAEPPRSAAPKDLALTALESAGRGAQIVLVDTSPAGEVSRAIWQVATLTIVVAEPGSEKMRSSYITVKRIHNANPGARIGLVLNCVRSYADGEDCFRKLAEVCRKFLKINLRNYGYILHSPVVNEAYQKATPLVKAFPDSKAAKCVEAILGLVMMDESAIARRRKEVTFEACASKKGRLQALKS